MSHEMRRSKQAIDRQECWAVLERGTSGVLALCGEEGQPYAVTLSYAILDGSLVFHPKTSIRVWQSRSEFRKVCFA